MKHIVKTVSLLSLIAVIPGAMAATSRVSMVSKSAPRLPSIAGYIMTTSGTTNTGTTNSTSTTTYLADVDCIDTYTDCIKADDVCGSDFQECTTNVLFHGQMSKCLSSLYQCSGSGINALFGTSAVNALSTVSSYKTVDGVQEVERYTYPTDGSVLGQLIIGAGITNKLTTEQCVRRYTNCLKRDDICGEDFELCTDTKSFKKQALLCDSTLARCQNDGKTELFGSVANAGSLRPSSDSRLGTMIDEGAALAALNAVKTCQKVTDNCLVGACLKNPFSCVEGTSLATIAAADIVAGGVSNMQTVNVNDEMYSGTTTASNVRKILKTQCLETIGANKYCHMTYLEKKPSNRDLADPDLQEEVFSLAYSARQSYANTKIQEEIKKFDTDAKDKCIDTIKNCAMRSCGGGLGSVCYKMAGNGTTGVHVNSSATYNDIKSGCAAIVNADANCQYAATSAGTDGYQYAYTNNDTFTTLFPEYTDSENDMIGAVASLNSILSTSYNDAAIENMKKQCQSTALACVKSMCGKDYENCYRNRTDIVAGTYDTGNAKLDRSMNKMGGIMDYNIVIGLCMNTVKTSSVCEEHLKIAAADWRNSEYKDTESWGAASSVREGWAGANTTKINTNAKDVLIGCAISTAEAQSKPNCVAYDRAEPINNSCSGVMDEDGCLYTEEIYQNNAEYVLENAGKSLFQQLLADVEKEAQAKYNAKLTKEQNVCLAQNQGGIMGATDNGSTFMWVKLKNNKVPKNYDVKGLNTKQFSASNDLYGSFCRARITVVSDDKTIQEALSNSGESTAYFAVGDSFSCGSWISQGTLDAMTNAVAAKARKEAGEGSKKAKLARTWAIVGGIVGGGAGGMVAGKVLQNKGLLGGTSKKEAKKEESALKECLENADKAKEATDGQEKVKYTNLALRKAREGGAKGLDNVAPFSEGQYYILTKYKYENKDIFTKLATEISKGCNNLSGDTKKTNCENYIKLANSYLDKAEPTKEDAKSVGENLKKAKEECKDKCKDLNIPDVKLQAYQENVNGEDNKLTRNINSELSVIEKACLDAQNSSKSTAKSKGALSAMAIGGAAVGGILGGTITKSVQKAKYEKAENAAVAEWMEEIGEHIQCYLGTEELGSYGDVVSFTIE